MFEFEEASVLKPLYSEIDPEQHLRVDADDIRKMVQRLTAALVGPCRYCLMVSADIDDEQPVYCAKATESGCPMKRSVECCLTCGEYKKRHT